MCRRKEHKDKTPRFIYAAWRFVATQGDKCLLEAQRISSVIMEHINWFCNDFHLCGPDLLCISRKQSSFMMALSWLELKKQSSKMTRSFISYSVIKVICTGEWAKVFHGILALSLGLDEKEDDGVGLQLLVARKEIFLVVCWIANKGPRGRLQAILHAQTHRNLPSS